MINENNIYILQKMGGEPELIDSLYLLSVSSPQAFLNTCVELWEIYKFLNVQFVVISRLTGIPSGSRMSSGRILSKKAYIDRCSMLPNLSHLGPYLLQKIGCLQVDSMKSGYKVSTPSSAQTGHSHNNGFVRQAITSHSSRSFCRYCRQTKIKEPCNAC